jgi:hypothetical protein
VIVDIIDYLGAPLTFVAGGIVVFVSGYFLKQNSLGLFQQNAGRPRAGVTFDIRKSPYAYIFFLGAALGLATTALFKFFPVSLEESLENWIPLQGKWMVVIILLISAFFSLPASKMTIKYGAQQVFRYSLAAIAVSILCIVLLPWPAVTFVFAVLFALSFAALSVSSLPLAINEANYYEKVFCVGIFFSGVELFDGIADVVMMW